MSLSTVESPESKVEGRAAAPLQLRPIRREDLPGLREAVAADNAEMIAPTHVLERAGDIVGYGSAGPLRLIAGWTDPAVSDAQSATALAGMEQAAAANGAQIVVVACTEDCRFKRLMAEAGYVQGKPVTLYYKKVKG